jgi:hypothetical protein
LKSFKKNFKKKFQKKNSKKNFKKKFQKKIFKQKFSNKNYSRIEFRRTEKRKKSLGGPPPLHLLGAIDK